MYERFAGGARRLGDQSNGNDREEYRNTAAKRGERFGESFHGTGRGKVARKPRG